MHQINTFYINGQWVEPAAGASFVDIVNPASEAVTGKLAMGGTNDVDRAVDAARAAFPAWSQTSRTDRLIRLNRIAELYKARIVDIAAAVTEEIGAPSWLSRELQATAGLGQIQATIAALEAFPFSTTRGAAQVVREPIGVVALITPWNWPLNQIAAKVAPALAAGCTMVLKPSEVSPLDARIFAEIVHEAGVPAGVFNMIYGDGKIVGGALSRHADVDMVSITGSTRAGVDVAINAAPTVKRVMQELGGKSPNLILDDADLKKAIPAGVMQCMVNSGQSCNAPTRMLVPRHLYEQAVQIAAATADALKVGDPLQADTKLGPISNRAQYERVQSMIETGIAEGARVAAGGPGRPDGLTCGFYARPTIFADVHNGMTIAREEVFGPVLVMIPYDSEAEAIELANDTPYGLAAYVWSADRARAQRVAGSLRAGTVQINGARMDFSAPFGGYKTSGNGREFGEYGLAEFLEYKTVVG
ncbi:3-succinoylsemialdehyde-pyridine dehydrogenase [Paraburkholderia hiiakae]|uniref:3-succinoylsemialdehyde-pyridine dehydrogenase n=1 Tax=Paraburkholderia hiiakae TaxID=1081782 RepID=A0ABM8PB67_9BURK|nr:aldehyde dehydrogenase family protein [Paraburkholderia hiiakae]CAD6561566.1 3-succinoylsemialdehyde-pyridine dehydrogenase [Paraburkholderia hiiakae]